ncbi:MAG: hypothetical protein O8C60_04900 [Candidatus Methanoperedens sp.]|nr:hypothetical protein [Candidatus Methanoperedens sp.]
MIGKLFVFTIFKNNERKNIDKFCKKFYGQETSSHGGKYHYRRHGFLEDIPHIKLIRGVIIVPTDSAEKVIQFLEEFNAEFFMRDIILLPEDEAVLSKKD